MLITPAGVALFLYKLLVRARRCQPISCASPKSNSRRRGLVATSERPGALKSSSIPSPVFPKGTTQFLPFDFLRAACFEIYHRLLVENFKFSADLCATILSPKCRAPYGAKEAVSRNHSNGSDWRIKSSIPLITPTEKHRKARTIFRSSRKVFEFHQTTD